MKRIAGKNNWYIKFKIIMYSSLDMYARNPRAAGQGLRAYMHIKQSTSAHVIYNYN